jgi:hypothetical protein
MSLHTTISTIFFLYKLYSSRGRKQKAIFNDWLRYDGGIAQIVMILGNCFVVGSILYIVIVGTNEIASRSFAIGTLCNFLALDTCIDNSYNSVREILQINPKIGESFLKTSIAAQK